MHKYRNNLFPKAKRFWFVNTQTNIVTHMAEVTKGKEHNNKRSDGSPKQKFKYLILAYHHLDCPFNIGVGATAQNYYRHVGGKPTPDLTKIWAIRDDRL